jgi:hypothetical protein
MATEYGVWRRCLSWNGNRVYYRLKYCVNWENKKTTLHEEVFATVTTKFQYRVSVRCHNYGWKESNDQGVI